MTLFSGQFQSASCDHLSSSVENLWKQKHRSSYMGRLQQRKHKLTGHTASGWPDDPPGLGQMCQRQLERLLERREEVEGRVAQQPGFSNLHVHAEETLRQPETRQHISGEESGPTSPGLSDKRPPAFPVAPAAI